MPSIAPTNTPLSVRNTDESDWKAALKNAFRNPAEVLEALELAHDEISIALDTDFSCLVPREFVAKMITGDIHDPLLRQVLPLAEEKQAVVDFIADPNEEARFHTAPGLIEKYAHRALLIATGGCAVNCRYCFRRNYPYQQAVGTVRLTQALTQIGRTPDISEVILSGGDPLVLDDETLDGLVQQLAENRHLKRLRIHTRFPVMIPSRLTPTLRGTLSDTRLNVALVLHINHPNEIDSGLIERLGDFHRAGINLLNQSVLLSGVNNNAEVLIELSEKLFEANIIPYYLHRLDQVSGSHHFAVPLEAARSLEKTLRAELPGYLVPKFVEEIPKETAKTPLHLL